MYKSLVFLFIFCFCAACAQTQKNTAFLAEDLHTTQWQESATAKVSCDLQDIPVGEEPDSILQERGLLQGVKGIFNSWLTKRLLFQELPPGHSDTDKSDFVQIDTKAEAVLDQETDMYTQTFDVQARFEPRANLQGEIIDIENERSMAASFDQVLIRGQSWTSRAEGAFFIIARVVPEIQGQALRTIGSGRIYHVLGPLAQGQLLETNREIQVGDRIYPVWISTKGLEEEQADMAPKEDTDVPEVVVEPQPVPQKEWSEPAEPK